MREWFKQWGQKYPNPRAHLSSGKRGLPSMIKYKKYPYPVCNNVYFSWCHWVVCVCGFPWSNSIVVVFYSSSLSRIWLAILPLVYWCVFPFWIDKMILGWFSVHMKVSQARVSKFKWPSHMQSMMIVLTLANSADQMKCLVLSHFI